MFVPKECWNKGNTHGDDGEPKYDYSGEPAKWRVETERPEWRTFLKTQLGDWVLYNLWNVVISDMKDFSSDQGQTSYIIIYIKIMKIALEDHWNVLHLLNKQASIFIFICDSCHFYFTRKYEDRSPLPPTSVISEGWLTIFNVSSLINDALKHWKVAKSRSKVWICRFLLQNFRGGEKRWEAS